MVKLSIKVEEGSTKVKVGEQQVNGITHFKVNCEANNQGDDTMVISWTGEAQGISVSRVISGEGEITVEIPESLGELLKGA